MSKKEKSRRFSILEQREKIHSIVLLHGFFRYGFYDHLAKTKPRNVFILEGRPRMESSQHAVKECLKRDITPTITSDNMAGFLFYKHLVKEVWISYQARNKEAALCPIGGLVLAVLGKKHFIPVLLSRGFRRIEDEGKPNEICSISGMRTAPKGTEGFVPLVESVPYRYTTKVF